MASPKYSVLQIRPAKDSLTGQSAFVEFLSSLKSSLKAGFFDRLFGSFETISFEILNLNQTTFFVVSCPERLEHLVKAQIAAQYPTALITPMNDYIPDWLSHGQPAVGQLVLSGPSSLPLNITEDDKVDQMASILGSLSRISVGQAAIVQICIFAAPKNWQKAIRGVIDKGIPNSDPLKPNSPHPQKAIIEKKLLHQAFGCDIRLIGVTPSYDTSKQLLSRLSAAFGTFALSEGNSLTLKIPKYQGSVLKLLSMIKDRSVKYSNQYQYLNYSELAALFHLPGVLLAPIKGIAWGKTLKGEAPTNLAVDEEIPADEQKKYNFFAKTEYKNHMAVFGMKRGIDRLRHTYILGKSGTGKSTLIGRMAINDIQHGEGVAFVDPHGDAAETLLDYVPESRIGDVAYLDPSVSGKSFWMNPLYVKTPAHGEMVASSIVSIFSKLYGTSWGPRLEYILRNTLLTLVYKPETTLVDVPRILTSKEFREKECLAHVTDPVLINFWHDEYDKYSEKFQTEAIAPILNKVGQFITSPTIRDIISHPKSTVDFEDMMNSGKIIILNLPQGKIGEDNAALLGAMFISQIQIAAMNRANIKEEERKEFFLYVDEFQNFATTSFVKILSEARKYKLGLILANQYIAQLPEEIQNAIFGNVGTVMSYVVGASDADRIVKELNNIYTPDDLVGLAKYQLVMKMSVDSQVTSPFSSYALPLPTTFTHVKDRVLASTYEKYYREIKPMDMSQVTFAAPPVSESSRYSDKPDFRAKQNYSQGEAQRTIQDMQRFNKPMFNQQASQGAVPQTRVNIPYQPQLPPTPPLTKPNPYKVPPSGSLATTKTASQNNSQPSVSTNQTQKSLVVQLPQLKDPTLEDLDSLRKDGLRPSIVGCFLNNQKLLLVYKKDFNLWSLPQGGIENREGLSDAFSHELGQEVTEDFVKKSDQNIKLISTDKIEFPPSKQGIRDMVTDSGDPIVMRGKYYYIVASEAKDTSLVISATEFDDYKWTNFEEAYKLIKETNTGGKLRMNASILHLLRDKGLLSTNQTNKDDTRPNSPTRGFVSSGSSSRTRDFVHPTRNMGERHESTPKGGYSQSSGSNNRDQNTATSNLPLVVSPSEPASSNRSGDDTKTTPTSSVVTVTDTTSATQS